MQLTIPTPSFCFLITFILSSFYSYPMFLEIEGYASTKFAITRWIHTPNKNVLTGSYEKIISPYKYDNDLHNYHLKFLPEYTYDILWRSNEGEKIVMGPLNPCIGTVIMNDEKIVAIHKQFQNPIESLLSIIEREFPSKNNVKVLLHSTDTGPDYNKKWKKFHNNRTQKEEMVGVANSINELGIDKKNIIVNLFKPSLLYSYADCANITINHLGKIRNIGLNVSGIKELTTHIRIHFLSNFTEYITTNNKAWEKLIAKYPLCEHFKYKFRGQLNVSLIRKETINCGNCPTCKKGQLPEALHD